MPRASTDEAVFRKCAWRLLPLITAGFLINFLARTNVGFAVLTINRELGFTPSVYGLAAGIFFVSYSIFSDPGESDAAQDRRTPLAFPHSGGMGSGGGGHCNVCASFKPV